MQMSHLLSCSFLFVCLFVSLIGVVESGRRREGVVYIIIIICIIIMCPHLQPGKFFFTPH